MAESLDPVERQPESKHSDRVNPADRSNPEKKDNGFSNALKEKMKEQLKKKARHKDEVILAGETDQVQTPGPEPDENDRETVVEPEAEGSHDDSQQEHIDLKA